MKIKCYIDSGENIDRFRNMANKHLDALEWDEQEKDLFGAPWTNYTEDSLGIDKGWIKQLLKQTKPALRLTIDQTSFFVSEDNWENGENEIWGWHLGSPILGSEITITKMRDNYEDTAMHELVHTLDDYIYIHLGVRLEDIFNVEDFDEDVVHGRDPRFEEYEYSDVLQTINPYLNKAVNKDLAGEEQRLLEKTLRLARRLKVQLQSGLKEQQAGEIKKEHEDIDVMARTVYGEARGEGELGWRALAYVIKNRKDHSNFPNDIRSVCLQPYQFSVWNPETAGSNPSANYEAAKSVGQGNKTYVKIKDICQATLEGELEDPTDGANHYHTDDMNPYPTWAQPSKQTAHIGNHIFYRL